MKFTLTDVLVLLQPCSTSKMNALAFPIKTELDLALAVADIKIESSCFCRLDVSGHQRLRALCGSNLSDCMYQTSPEVIVGEGLVLCFTYKRTVCTYKWRNSDDNLPSSITTLL